MLGVASIPFILNIVSSWARGPKAPANPWNAIGLEWFLPSPPPAENFEDDVPTVISEPYGYGLGKPLVEDQDFYVRPIINYTATDSLALEMGANVFSGKEDYTFFGQFHHNTNLYGAVRFSF